jgi:hypothetical protein
MNDIQDYHIFSSFLSLSPPRNRETAIFNRNLGVFFFDLGEFRRYQIRTVVFGDIRRWKSSSSLRGFHLNKALMAHLLS